MRPVLVRLVAATVPAAFLTGPLVAAPVAATPPPAVGTTTPMAAGSCEEGRTQYVPDTPPGLLRLGATRAWPLATGAGVTVAVVDSGVDARNDHFPGGTVLEGRSLVGGSARADRRLHGTAVAGIIAARPLGSRSGVQGLARGARILPVKVVPDESREEGTGDADPGVLAEGIRWAADEGALVVNVSLSTPRDDARLRKATEYALGKGSLVVAAAGNRASDDDPEGGVRYPAAYPGVLGVAATDGDDRVSDVSLRGEHVDLAAPGVDVLTTYGAWGDCYLGAEGATSYAAAYVSAAAALVAQRFPRSGPEAWAHRLTATAARDRRDARDDAVGWGVVQPVEALTAVLDDSVAGPLLPGAAPRETEAAPVRRLTVEPVADPLAGDRRTVLWLVVAGTSLLLGLALRRVGRRRAGA
ncbi:S8 family serine peptidase [Phycicoccus sp. CSK15P-2]|uniref:S8 family serine peptidase n=1 Tax=Phycicoccus sp. CSK15P-2 TaxID=2807627 RepID=UPI00194FE356|nr:S8 family serine peptidase [Phycicoccus sp. CSK15P-2]MBM6404235.1 S8 family serine peptidase [Phycicoccus sp. CSK15P-2]